MELYGLFNTFLVNIGNGEHIDFHMGHVENLMQPKEIVDL
jgi:hypothetical protein